MRLIDVYPSKEIMSYFIIFYDVDRTMQEWNFNIYVRMKSTHDISPVPVHKEMRYRESENRILCGRFDDKLAAK